MVIWDGSVRKLIRSLLWSWSLQIQQRWVSGVWRQTDHHPIERSSSPSCPQEQPSSASPDTSPVAVSSSSGRSWRCLKLRPPATKEKKANIDLLSFLGLGTGRFQTNWSNPDFEKEVYKCFFIFLPSSGGGRWRAAYLHPSDGNWSSESLPGEGRAFSQTVFGFSPGEEGRHLEQGRILLSQKFRANYQPFQRTLA